MRPNLLPVEEIREYLGASRLEFQFAAEKCGLSGREYLTINQRDNIIRALGYRWDGRRKVWIKKYVDSQPVGVL